MLLEADIQVMYNNILFIENVVVFETNPNLVYLSVKYKEHRRLPYVIKISKTDAILYKNLIESLIEL